jgi:hypothetical protein
MCVTELIDGLIDPRGIAFCSITTFMKIHHHWPDKNFLSSSSVSTMALVMAA